MGADLARHACARLSGPPDVVVVVATQPWAEELGVLRRALRAALPPTCCSLATTTLGSNADFAVGLLALRLERPCANFGAAAVAAVNRAVAPFTADLAPSHDALDLVALFDDEEAKEPLATPSLLPKWWQEKAAPARAVAGSYALAQAKLWWR